MTRRESVPSEVSAVLLHYMYTVQYDVRHELRHELSNTVTHC
jgi:hypothetical protein